MNNASKKEEANKFGPAAITMSTDEKGIEIGFGVLMTGRDVENYELNITKPESHTCVIDGDKAYREYTNKESGKKVKQKANLDKMKEILKTRKAQGRDVKEVTTTQNKSR